MGKEHCAGTIHSEWRRVAGLGIRFPHSSFEYINRFLDVVPQNQFKAVNSGLHRLVNLLVVVSGDVFWGLLFKFRSKVVQLGRTFVKHRCPVRSVLDDNKVHTNVGDISAEGFHHRQKSVL